MKILKKILPAVSVLALAAAVTSPARADGFTPLGSANLLTPYAGATLSMTVSPYASGETTYVSGLGNVYVGLDQITLAYNGSTVGSFWAFCDDFSTQISVPATYNVNVVSVPGHIDLEQEAYLGMLFGPVPSGNATRDADIHELIWNYSGGAFALNADMTALNNQMLANFSTTDYSKSWLLAATNGGQSFMIAQPNITLAPTPEPPTLITLATGLFGVAGFIRRRATRNAA